MRRLALVLLLCFVISSPALPASSWVNTTQKAMQSTVALRNQRGINCSGIVIDNKRDYVLTAAHCLRQVKTLGLSIDKKTTVVKWVDRSADLAVVQAVGIDRPAIRRGKAVRVGQPIASFGFAYGRERGTLKTGHVASTHTPIEGQTGTWTVLGYPMIGGMSGGPVFNMKGRLVGISLRTNYVIGYSRSIDDIMNATRDYWEHL